MCWRGKVNDKKIADKPIKVFKLLYKDTKHNKYHPPFFKYTYELGKTYGCLHIESKHVFGKTCVEIHIGYHCYSSNRCYTERKFNNLYVVWRGDSGAFIQYYELAKVFDGVDMMYLPLKLVECEIPKGAEYWENGEGEIVASAIVIKRELEMK